MVSSAKDSRGVKEEEERDVHAMTRRPGDATNFPKRGDTVQVHYVGYVGKKAEVNAIFDSSKARSQPYTAKIGSGQLIPAWESILPSMSVGQVVEIVCSPSKAYGAAGYPPIIPGNSHVTYEIELLGFSSPAATS